MNATTTARRSTTRAATILVTTAITAATAGAAEAGSTYRYWSRSAEAFTTIVDDVAGEHGNVHEIHVSAQRTSHGTYLSVQFTDWACDEGEVPGWGWWDEFDTYHGEGYCDHLGYRWGSSDVAAVSISGSLKGSTASGTVEVFDGWEEGATSTTVEVNLTWRGTGKVTSDSSKGSYREGKTRYEYSYSHGSRSAAVTGTIDGAAVAVDGSLSRYSYSEKVR